MPGTFATISALFAQNAGGSSNSITPFLFLAFPLLFFYMLILRPQQQQEKKRRLTIDALKKNDRVLTAAGMYGTVVSVDHEHDKVVLRVDDDKNVRITFSKAGIVKVMDLAQEKEKEKAGEPA